MKRCNGDAAANQLHISGCTDEDLMEALSAHADPLWWKEVLKYNNKAYLKRWGTYLRREARKRGLL